MNNRNAVRWPTWILLAGLSGCLPYEVSAADWDVASTGAPSRDAEFELTEGTWMTVDVSPDGHLLAFDLLGDIYVMPASGGDATLVHGGPAMQRDPEFSPDGTQLLFVSDADGADNAWVSDIDGSRARRITDETVNAITGPGWGHDGTYIVAARLFSSADKLRASELLTFRIADGASTQVVAAPANGESVHEAQVSPDGRYLYYTEKVSGPTTSVVYIDANHINYAVKRLDRETGETREIAKGFGSATTPRLSPDARKLAFVRRVMTKTVLFVVDLVSGEEIPVFDGLDRDAQADFIWQGSYYPQYDWFDDGQYIAIWRQGKLWRVDTRDGNAEEIPFRAEARHRMSEAPRFTNDLAPQTFTVRAIRQLAYPSDGSLVVFNGLGHLWLKDLPDGVPRRLTNGNVNEFEPAFSPDDRHLVWIEWHDERGSRLVIRDLASGDSRALLESNGVLRTPSFSADGHRIVYVIDQGDRCLGGHSLETGTYEVGVRSGKSRRIAEPVTAPQFSPDGERIWFTTSGYENDQVVTRLESTDLTGSGRRVHAEATGADIGELRISPDLRWITFAEHHQYYLARYRDQRQPAAVSSDALANAVQLTNHSGYGLTWSADSSRVYWSLGESLYSAPVSSRSAAAAQAVPAGLRVAAEVPDGVVALVNARIVTLAGEREENRTIEQGTIVVRQNRIAAIGERSAVDIPDGATVLDVTGKTVLPGFVDMHGHLSHCYYTSSGLMPQKQPSRYSALAYGVTTNYDPYTSELPAYSQSEMTLSGHMVGPRAIESGHVAYGRSGKSDRVFVPIEDYDDAKALMARKQAVGGTIIKSYRQPMRRQRQQLIEAGRAAGIMVDVEGESNFYNNLTSIIDGQTNLQHNLPVPTYYDDVVQLMAHGDTGHTPTLVVLFGELMGENYIYQHMRVWDDPKARTFIQVTTSGYSPLGTPHYAPPYVRGMTTIHASDELYDIGFRAVSRSMKRLDEAGVTITAGSHGQAAGLALHWEMWLLAEGGMSNERILRTATINGAWTLGLDQQIGSLEVGKLADLIVLDENPLEDIRNSNSVRYTMVNGRLYDAASMNEIGNYDRPRGRFYWETGRTSNIADWNKAWAHQ